MSRTLLIIIVLTITAALSFQSVRPLETGYEYSPEETITDVELQKHLKCTYLFSGLTHMRLTASLFDRSYICINSKISYIIAPNHFIKSQLATLYGLAEISIGALWLINVYTSLLADYLDIFKKLETDQEGTTNELAKIVATHNYVIEKLESDASGCRKGNDFDRLNGPTHLISFKRLKKLLNENNEKARGLLVRNHDGKYINLEMTEKLKARNLLMNNLGNQKLMKQVLMNSYNVKVQWSITDIRLELAWIQAHSLNWATDNLKNIQIYIDLHFSFLKFVMFQLVSIHLEYSKVHKEESYAQEWRDLLVEFATLLHIEDDPDVGNLLNSIDKMVNGLMTVDEVLYYLNGFLEYTGPPLGCEVTRSISLHGEKCTTTCQGLHPDTVTCSTETSSKQEPIKYNRLVNAKHFLSHLKFIFADTDFGAIRLFLKYIEKINRYSTVPAK